MNSHQAPDYLAVHTFSMVAVNFLLAPLAKLSPISHLQNDGATGECSASPEPISNSMLLGLKIVEEKKVRKGQRWGAH